MSVIINKGGFDFSCKTPTGKIIPCFMDSSEPVEANFNKLELSYSGIVRVLVSRKKVLKEKDEKGRKKIETKEEYISVGRLKSRWKKGQEDFITAYHETEIVSQKRKRELKSQSKANSRKKEPLKRTA